MSQQYVQRRRQPPTTYNQLVETQTYLEKLRAEQPKVAQHLAKWSSHRQLTVKTVDQLQKRLDKVCMGCNVAKTVGAVAGIGGLIAGIVGFFVDDEDTASRCNEVSKYCAGASLATLVTSTLLELGLSQSAINEIKRVIKEDIELTKPLRNWIEFSHHIDYRFRDIFRISLASDTFFGVMNVFRQCIRILDAGSFTVQDIIRSLGNCKMEGIEDVTIEVAGKVVHFLRGMLTDPALLQPLREICRIFQETPYTFELASSGALIYCNTANLLNTTFVSNCLASVGLSLPLTSVTSSMRQCALGTITFASHVVTLILSIQKLKEGESKYSEALDRVKMALSLELRDVKEQMNTHVPAIYSGNDFEADYPAIGFR